MKTYKEMMAESKDDFGFDKEEINFMKKQRLSNFDATTPSMMEWDDDGVHGDNEDHYYHLYKEEYRKKKGYVIYRFTETIDDEEDAYPGEELMSKPVKMNNSFKEFTSFFKTKIKKVL
jgi:hypothetical protein